MNRRQQAKEKWENGRKSREQIVNSRLPILTKTLGTITQVQQSL